MTGPTAEVLSGYGAEPRQRTDSGSLEDEPWDQRRPKNRVSPSVSREEEELQFQRRMIAMNTKANPIRGSGGGRRGIVSPNGAGDEELLDDGDLPSLATSHAPAAAARAADADGADAADTAAGELLLGGRTTQPLKSPSASSGTTGRKKAERRKFWGQMEGADSEQPGTTNKEEDGPHDEMAARRRRRTAQPKGGEDDDTDYDSVPTDIESQMTEEEVEEEYETSFCGQTLNAIGDICGGNLNNNLTNEEAAAIKGDDTGRSPRSRSPRSHRSPSNSVGSPLSPRYDPTMQQEHTAIEVEFVEPVASKKSSKRQLGESSSGTAEHQEGEGTRSTEVMSDPSDVSSKKAAYLNAIAKRAKENFRRKKGKDIPSEAFVDATIQTSRATPASLSGSTEKGAVVPESAPEQKLSSSDGGSFDEDYNSFSPAEKRKFVKLINGGMSASEATHQVINERKLAAVEQEGKSAPKGAARLAFWKRTQQQQQQQGPALKTSGSGSQVDSDADEPDGGAPQNKSADLPDDEKSSGIDPATRNLDEGGGDFPFQKSGVNYYDAVRKEVQLEDDSDEGSRAKSRSRSEAGRGPRLFGKTRGFSALDDSSTEDHSKKSAPRDKMPTAVSPTEDQDQSKSVPPSQQAASCDGCSSYCNAAERNERSGRIRPAG